MKKKFIQEAINNWDSGEYFFAAKVLYEHMPNKFRPLWAADLLELCHKNIKEIEEIKIVIEIARNQSRWSEAHEAFSLIRTIRNSMQESGFPSSIFEIILILAENTCKVTYNASGQPAPFDRNAGWRIGENLALILKETKDENSRKAIFNAFFCLNNPSGHKPLHFDID